MARANRRSCFFRRSRSLVYAAALAVVPTRDSSGQSSTAPNRPEICIKNEAERPKVEGAEHDPLSEPVSHVTVTFVTRHS
jgi:hypothetical protein